MNSVVTHCTAFSLGILFGISTGMYWGTRRAVRFFAKAWEIEQAKTKK